MNSFIYFILHIFSFLIIYNIFSYINLDEKIFFFLTPTINDNTNRNKDLLKEEG